MLGEDACWLRAGLKDRPHCGVFGHRGAQRRSAVQRRSVQQAYAEGSSSNVRRLVTATQPRVGTTSRLTGTSYAVIMIDLDIPTNTSKTNTLLHWMQTGLTPATSATMLNTTSGQNMVFLLQNSTKTAPAAPYIAPGPPAQNPLSHRYTQILIDTSGLTTQSTSALETAAKTRLGFEAMTVLMQAGLDSKVVAGNSFNVTNPGPAQNSKGGGFSNSTTGTTGGKSPSGTGSRPGASSTFVAGAGSITGRSSGFLLALLGVVMAL
jgi:phosphatidylethanolamine-binding protein (PEBP) family uncharacterized protein